MTTRETLPITEALANQKPSIAGINAAGIIERELRSLVEELKVELTGQIQADVIEPLKALTRVLADQAADRECELSSDEKPLMTLKDLENTLQWSESKIRREIAAGRFPKPITPKGKKQFWKRTEVMRKLNQGR